MQPALYRHVLERRELFPAILPRGVAVRLLKKHARHSKCDLGSQGTTMLNSWQLRRAGLQKTLHLFLYCIP